MAEGENVSSGHKSFYIKDLLLNSHVESSDSDDDMDKNGNVRTSSESRSAEERQVDVHKFPVHRPIPQLLTGSARTTLGAIHPALIRPPISLFPTRRLTPAVERQMSECLATRPAISVFKGCYPGNPIFEDAKEQRFPVPIPLPFYVRMRDALTTSCDGCVKSKRCRRSRTVFTELQLMGLEKRFETQKYLSTPDRVDLADHLGLSQLQVKTWYQNRRMKWKKQVMQNGGTEPPTKPKGRPRKVAMTSSEPHGDKGDPYLELNLAASSSEVSC